MGYSVDWLIENEIVYAKFWGNGDANELRSALTDIANMRSSSPREAVHIITDTQGVTTPVRFQDSMNVIKEFDKNSGSGWEIVVGKLDRIMKLSLSISRSILRNKSINVITIEEAFTLLKKEDQMLNWDKFNHSVLGAESDSII